MAAIINHSCNGNASRSFIGDMMILRATRDLDPNTEIVVEYQAPVTSESRMEPMNLWRWGFQCTCEVCQDLRNSKKGVLIRREKLRNDILSAFECMKPDTNKIEAMLSKLTATYRQPASVVPRFSMWELYYTLVTVYGVHGQIEEAIDSSFRTLESLGYIIEGGRLPHTPGKPLLIKKWGLMQHGLVGCWMGLAIACHAMKLDIAAQAESMRDSLTRSVWVKTRPSMKPTARSQKDQTVFLSGKSRGASRCEEILFLFNIGIS